MKRYIIVILTFILILPISVNAKDLSGDNVTLNNCVDGNSARFMLGVNEIKVKFLGIETEEKIKDDETDEINDSLVSDYVCSSLKSAKKIRIEYEPNVEKEDKFGRIEAWVFVDDILLQEDLVKNGYAKIMYVNEDFTYLDKLQDAQDFAKKNNLGIWKDTKQEESKDTKEDNKKNKKKSKGILEIIFDFIADLFNQLFSFIDDLIKNIF
jgi:micrococcal nuclease